MTSHLSFLSFNCLPRHITNARLNNAKNAHLNINLLFLNYITGSVDVPILCLPTRNGSQYLPRHLLIKNTFYIFPHKYFRQKIPVTYTKCLLWKCLHIHQIRGENEEQKIKLTWPTLLKCYSLNPKHLFWLHKIKYFFKKLNTFE